MSGVNGKRLRVWALAVTACLAGWAGAAAAAGAGTGRAPAQGVGGVTAWLPYWEFPAALSSTLENSSLIGTASPYWYQISGDSDVRLEPGAGSPTVISELLAHHQQVVPMVTEAAGFREFGQILSNPATRMALVRALVRIAAHPGYAGLDVDFESFAYDPSHATTSEDRLATLYSRFIAETCRALHAIGRTCQVAVMARTSSARTYAHGDIPTWLYDYRALAAVADRIQLMAYDYHSPGGSAGPVAPLPWVKRVIAYAVTQGDPRHFELGVPAYGYDWSGRTSATAVYAGQVTALVDQVRARPQWNALAGEETFSYESHHLRHTVWVLNARADAERASLAARAGLSGVAVWAAGYEQPQLWSGLDLHRPR